MAKPHSSASNITELEDHQRTLHSDQASLEGIYKDFYQNLFTNPLPRIDQEEVATFALEQIGDKLTGGMKLALSKTISMEELNLTVKDLGKRKSPGLNGVTSEFFQI